MHHLSLDTPGQISMIKETKTTSMLCCPVHRTKSRCGSSLIFSRQIMITHLWCYGTKYTKSCAGLLPSEYSHMYAPTNILLL